MRRAIVTVFCKPKVVACSNVNYLFIYTSNNATTAALNEHHA